MGHIFYPDTWTHWDPWASMDAHGPQWVVTTQPMFMNNKPKPNAVMIMGLG